MIGETISHNGKSFEIIKQIGKGKGGYSYLAKTEETFVVLKKMHYEPCDIYQFEDNKLKSELRDYKILADVEIPMPKLLHMNEDEQILIKEYIDGDTLAEIVAKNELTDEHIIQIYEMCALLYPNNLNIDYFPTNFVVDGKGKIYYIDYECNTYMEEWDFENWGIYFLANTDGMAQFFKTGDHSFLSENAKPHRDGFEQTVDRWLKLKEKIHVKK
ncbi:MAG: hypothetical protein FWG36_07735 [Oscillospiraceae bacterium]|nr:hypothetical protein [Oscillospiraceae bacterium]